MSDDESISTTPDPSDPWIGQSFAGYVILQQIGHGGMGIIYLARHSSLDRLAAVKFLPAHIANNQAYIELFLREAKAAAKLSHPNIVGVHDAGCLGEGVYYIIMEYVEGRDLRSILDEQGPLPIRNAAEYICQAAAALGYAHKKHLIHRDIKPENLLLTNEGIIKVVDLGLAKWAGEESSMMTQTGDILGSPIYISPERLRDPNTMDPRLDIYSLGGTFFHLVTGKIPYEGSTAVIMARHLNDPVPDPRDVEPNLDEAITGIIMKMMAKDPAGRYQTMEEVEAALKAYLGGSSVQRAPKKRKPRKKRDLWIAFVSVLAISAALSFIVMNLLKERSKNQQVEAPAATPSGRSRIVPAVVADFNKGDRFNNLNGTLNVWNSHSPDPLGHCSERVEQGAGPDGSPCWRIQCAISMPRTYGGTWMTLELMDGSPYNTLTFKVRTDQPSLNFTVELKIKPGNTQIVGKKVLVSATQQWQTIEIPLSSFALPTLQALDHFVIIFNQEITGPRDGVVFIDDMVLSDK